MTEAAFHQLQVQIRSGDERGLRYVFEECKNYCVRTLIKKTSCTMDDAEDIFMDAILIFRENMLNDKLTQLSNLKTYQFGICWNLWRDLHRARAKWGKENSETERQWMLIKADENEDLESDKNEFAEQQIKLVTDALSMLKEKCRQLLTYVYVEQRSQKEITELMSFASVGVVKVTRHRCYQQWVKHIEKAKKEKNGSR